MIITYPVGHTWELYDSDKLSSVFKGLLVVEQLKLEICFC